MPAYAASDPYPEPGAAAERRTAERILLDLPVTMSFNAGGVRWTETDAALVDVSPSGMFIRCDRQPGDDNRILIGLLHPRFGLCAAAGKLARCDGWGGFGVQFERCNDALLRLVDELGRLAPGQRSSATAGHLEARVWIEAAASPMPHVS